MDKRARLLLGSAEGAEYEHVHEARGLAPGRGRQAKLGLSSSSRSGRPVKPKDGEWGNSLTEFTAQSGFQASYTWGLGREPKGIHLYIRANRGDKSKAVYISNDDLDGFWKYLRSIEHYRKSLGRRSIDIDNEFDG